MNIEWKWHDYNWRIYIAWYADFMSSKDRNVRRAWWFLWHGREHRYSNRCYRICGLTLFGREVLAPADTTGVKG